MKKSVALILVLTLVFVLSVSVVALANNGNGATVEETEDGKLIYVPGKEPAGNANTENPANCNPIHVAGD